MFMSMITVGVVGAAKHGLCGPRFSPIPKLQPAVNMLTDGLPQCFPEPGGGCDGSMVRAHTTEDQDIRLSMLASGGPQCFPEPGGGCDGGIVSAHANEDQLIRLNILANGRPQCFPEPGGGCTLRAIQRMWEG